MRSILLDSLGKCGINGKYATRKIRTKYRLRLEICAQNHESVLTEALKYKTFSG